MTMVLRNVETSESTARFDFLDVDEKITHIMLNHHNILTADNVHNIFHFELINGSLRKKRRKVVPAILLLSMETISNFDFE